jgi:hypothetical protein
MKPPWSHGHGRGAFAADVGAVVNLQYAFPSCPIAEVRLRLCWLTCTIVSVSVSGVAALSLPVFVWSVEDRLVDAVL